MAAAMLAFTAFGDFIFPLLSLDREATNHGQYWRLLTANWVHFGWYHTLMNTCAFLLCAFAFFTHWSIRQFLIVSFFIQLCVGMGVYWFNPEYAVYAGLSGAIHGYILVGLSLDHRHKIWIRALLAGALIGKVIYEHSTNYQTTSLQELLPVPVAYDAHLYGVIAGCILVATLVIKNRITK